MIVVVIPTFCEAEAMPPLVRSLRDLALADLHVLVMDDGSPDGTADRLEAMGDSGLVVRRRQGPRGRGLAGREGFVEALAMGAEVVVEMDGDGSHRPEDLPGLLARLEDADLVVGSRFVEGGGDGRGLILRNWLSRATAAFLRWRLALSLRDPGSGFRAFRAEALRRIRPETLRSSGPEIVEEVLLRARDRELRMVEHPIRMQGRAAGCSKLGFFSLLGVFRRVMTMRSVLDKSTPGDES